MKKVVLICLLIAVSLSACSTMYPQSETTEPLTDLTVNFATDLTLESETESGPESTANNESTNILVNNSETTIRPSSTSANNETPVHPEPPYIVSFTLESFASFKKAYESMSAEDFVEFLRKSDDNYYDNSVRNREDAKKVIDITENNTVILLDGKKENFYEIALYIESDYLVQPVIVTDTKNLVCRYYPKQNEKGFSSSFAYTEKAVFIKEVTSDGVTAKVYDYEGELNAEMIVNETRIAYRVTEEQTIEEFEADFARLQFVKIGDLLKE